MIPELTEAQILAINIRQFKNFLTVKLENMMLKATKLENLVFKTQ